MLIFICTDEKGRIELLQNFPSLTGCLIDPATRRPAMIRDKEMEQFKFMLDYSEETVRFQNEPLAPGEQVEVIKGSLKGLQGELVEIGGHSQVMIRIDHLLCHRGNASRIRKESIRLISQKRKREYKENGGSCMLEKQLPAVLCYWKNTSSRRVVFSSSISVRRSLQGSKSPGISKVSS